MFTHPEHHVYTWQECHNTTKIRTFPESFRRHKLDLLLWVIPSPSTLPSIVRVLGETSPSVRMNQILQWSYLSTWSRLRREEQHRHLVVRVTLCWGIGTLHQWKITHLGQMSVTTLGRFTPIRSFTDKGVLVPKLSWEESSISYLTSMGSCQFHLTPRPN